MLVLSRKLHQKILLPGIHTAIQVVDIRGGVVRLGIEAPPEVAVLREELQDRAAEEVFVAPKADERTAQWIVGDFQQQLRERLKDTGLGLGLLRLLLDAGDTKEAKAALLRIQEELGVLRRGVDGELQQAAPKSAATPRKNLRALLVEDDHNERELLAGFLRLSGLEVDTAGDGADALDYLRSNGHPDVVLMDMGLPRVDGPTTVREIRRDPSCAGMKIFGVSGRLPDEFDLASGPAGIDRWFHKPLDPSALVKQLTRELRPVGMTVGV